MTYQPGQALSVLSVFGRVECRYVEEYEGWHTVVFADGSRGTYPPSKVKESLRAIALEALQNVVDNDGELPKNGAQLVQEMVEHGIIDEEGVLHTSGDGCLYANMIVGDALREFLASRVSSGEVSG